MVDICFIHVVQLSSCLLRREIILINMEIKERCVCNAQKVLKNNSSRDGCGVSSKSLLTDFSNQRCLQRDQRPLDLHAPELKQTSLPRTLLNSCYYILEKKKSHHLAHYPVKEKKNKKTKLSLKDSPQGQELCYET